MLARPRFASLRVLAAIGAILETMLVACTSEAKDGTAPEAASSKCEHGPHTIKSEGPVGVTAWDLASWASHAYPAGGSIAAINAVVVAPKPR